MKQATDLLRCASGLISRGLIMGLTMDGVIWHVSPRKKKKRHVHVIVMSCSTSVLFDDAFNNYHVLR